MDRIIIIYLLLLPNYINAQFKNNPLIEIADFPSFKSGAISLTFDDGSISQFTMGLKGLDSMYFKGTFFVNPGSLGEENWTRLRGLIKAGHEVGSHTMSHPHLKEISLDAATTEIKQSKEVIEQKIGNYQCISFAYPFGESNENIRQLTSSYFQTARTTDGGFFPVDASYYMKIPGFLFTSETKLQMANTWVDNAIHGNKWAIEIFHGFGEDGWSPISQNLYLSHLQYIKSKENYLWITTFGNAIKYFKERKSAKIEMIDSSYNFYKINVSDDLPDSIYNFPLTIRVKIPNNWSQINIIQENRAIPFQLKPDLFNNQFVVFDAIPDQGQIDILSEKVNVTDTLNCTDCYPIVFPNPFYQELSILSGKWYKGTVYIYNSGGSVIYESALNSDHFNLNTSSWSNGAYIIEIKLTDVPVTIKRILLKQ